MSNKQLIQDLYKVLTNSLTTIDSSNEQFDDDIRSLMISVLEEDDVKNHIISSMEQSLKSEKPKKTGGKSGYLFFCQDMRKTLKEDNPDAKFGEMSKKLGILWKQLSDEDKKVYNDKAKEHNSSSPSPQTEKKKEHKGGANGYILWSKDNRKSVKEQNPDKNNKEIMNILGKMWKELDDDTKLSYNDKAKQSRTDDVVVCEYILSKGKNKGEKCGKKNCSKHTE